MMVQAYVGRYFLGAGERLVLSAVTGRLSPRQIYTDIRETMLQVMLMVAIATLAFILVLVTALPPAAADGS
jgi:hypothetical protein